MTWRQVLDMYEVLDDADVSGAEVAALFDGLSSVSVEYEAVVGDRGSTDFIRIMVQGRSGKLVGGESPTLGIIGRLGGLGARPEQVGFVSDGDGALAALAAAAKLRAMVVHGDQLDGDVIIATHICPNAPTRPHQPVPFMASPVGPAEHNSHEVDTSMDAILSIDTTKGNRICNHLGIAITPTVKDGWILRVSEDLLGIYERVTGKLATVLPITTQDITPYGNDVFHVNSILQPSVATTSPVVGIAVTSESTVGGSATGATDLRNVEQAARLAVEVAKDFGRARLQFYDEEEFRRLTALYGSLSHLRGA